MAVAQPGWSPPPLGQEKKRKEGKKKKKKQKKRKRKKERYEERMGVRIERELLAVPNFVLVI